MIAYLVLALSIARFQECPQCPSVTVIPAGHFTMTYKEASDGRKEDDPEGQRKTHPARPVDLPVPFGLGTYPVTRRQYGIFVRETHRAIEKGCHVRQQGVWVPDETLDWQHPGFSQTEEDPVVCVSWNDAQDYIHWLNEQARAAPYDAAPGPYRLPTWEELEYATRAGTSTLYYWGNAPRRDQANYGQASCLPCGPQQQGSDQWLNTSPVGSFPANPWGLYDMAGNVWQWMEGCHGDPNSRPPMTCPFQLLHGGSWLTSPEYLQTGARSYALLPHRNYEVGFRIARTLASAGKTFRDCVGDCPLMAVIPAGTFFMGTGRLEVERERRERLTHKVTFAKPFALGVYDVTRGEFARFVRASGYPIKQGCNILDVEGHWVTDPDKGWSNPGFSQTDQDPVVCVSWNDAHAYVAWLNGRVHSGDSMDGPYRLPSDAEWEYAARAGSSTSYYWGSEASHELANYGIEDCNPCGARKDGRDRWYFTSPAGSFAPNAFGLYDVAGNVWQITEDCMHYNFDGAPADGSAWMTDTNRACYNHPLRGGSWLDPGSLLTLFERNPWGSDDHNYANGFRVARTLDEYADPR